MDLPPSGWYPDPYGTPSLLRWWDGTGWTQHTHPDVTASAHGDGGAPATTVQGAVAEGVAAGPAGSTAAADGTAVAGTAVQDAVRATTVQPSVAATALQSTTAAPSAQQLSRTKPPTGPPTQPQPALPVDLAAAAYQATTVGSGAFQPTAVQPGYPQPGAGWGPGGGAGGAGTQVIAFGGEPWQAPGGPTPGSTNPYGYQEAQRRRRRRLIVGAAAGALVAIATIAVIASSLGGSPSTPAADQSPAVPSPTAAAPSATVAASVSASPSASASPSVTASGQVTDAQSGLSYNQLSTPWQATASCPSTLNNGAFPWTDGEYATAGQVNGDGGPVTWYGEACSGPLPQQYYNYTGTADLQTAADSLASTFENAYYNPLDHNITPGQDTPIQVSGHAAWEVSYDVTYPNATAQGATWTDEQAAVVVVDTGTATPAVFFVSIPSTLNEGSIASLVSSLQLTAPPSSAQASSQPSTTAPAAGPGGGGDEGGGGNGGGGPNP